MCALWEDGDRVLTKRFSEEELVDRSYVFEIIRKHPGAFMETKRCFWSSEKGAYWELHYRAEGCRSFDSWMAKYLQRNRLEMHGYLKMMTCILSAMEEAEDGMIMTASFEIAPDTIWYQEDEDRVKFMYVPRRLVNEDGRGTLWIRRSVPKVLLELLFEVTRIDVNFSERWPHLQPAYQEWDERNAGHHYCMKQICSWLREFPENPLERILE